MTTKAKTESTAAHLAAAAADGIDAASAMSATKAASAAAVALGKVIDESAARGAGVYVEHYGAGFDKAAASAARRYALVLARESKAPASGTPAVIHARIKVIITHALKSGVESGRALAITDRVLIEAARAAIDERNARERATREAAARDRKEAALLESLAALGTDDAPELLAKAATVRANLAAPKAEAARAKFETACKAAAAALGTDAARVIALDILTDAAAN